MGTRAWMIPFVDGRLDNLITLFFYTQTSDLHSLNAHKKRKIRKNQSGEKQLLKKKQAKEELVPVLVQQHEGSEKFPAFKIHEKVESDQHGINVSFSNIGLVANVVSMGKHVYIHGVMSGTLMPLPKFDMRTMPCKACVLPEVPSCHLCLAKRFPYEPLGFYCAREMYLCIQRLFLISYKNCSRIQLQNLHILGTDKSLRLQAMDICRLMHRRGLVMVQSTRHMGC